MLEKQRHEICLAIAERLNVPIELLVPQATMESLNINSLSFVEFLFEMEDKFGISLSELLEQPKTLEDVFSAVDKALLVKLVAAQGNSE